MSKAASHPERCFYRVRDMVAMTGLSKDKVFAAIRAGRLSALKLEGVVLIPAESLESYLAQAVPWQGGETR